jgi:hypothetical protein
LPPPNPLASDLPPSPFPPPPPVPQEDDVESFRSLLALRLAKCIGGLHFQVSERTLLLWNSERVAALLLESAAHRPPLLRYLFPVLFENQQNHWHESIRTLSGHILEQYGEMDHELFYKLKDEHEASQAAKEAAAAAREAQHQAVVAAAQQATAAAAAAAVAASSSASASAGGGASSSSSSSSAAGGAVGVASSVSGLSGSGADAPASASASSSSSSSTSGLGSPGGPSGGVRALSPSAAAGPGGVGAAAGGPGGADKSPAGSLSHHRAPAVRASSSFAVSDNADLLPHHRGGGEAGTPGKRDGHGRTLGGHGHSGMSLPMPIPSMGPGGDGAEGGGED